MRPPSPFIAVFLLTMFALSGCGRINSAQAGLSTSKVTSKKAGTSIGGQSLTGAQPVATMFGTGTGTLRGRVLDVATQHGVSGAVVMIQPGGMRVTTDATGNFHVDGVPVGTYTFTAMTVGLLQVSTNGTVVEARQEATVPDITMAPGNGPSGISSITYSQEAAFGREGEPPATLLAPQAVAVRGNDVMVLDLNGSPGVKTGIVRQYNGESGKFLGKFGDYSKWLGFSQMKDTVKALTLDQQGRTIVLDGARQIWRFGANGDKEKILPIEVDDGADITTDPTTGAIWIAHRGGLTKLNAEGEGAVALGSLGECRAVAVGKDGVWVLTGNKVQRLSPEGAMVLEFGASGSDKPDTFQEASDLAVDPRNGNIVVVDRGAKNVYVYDAVGVLIGKVGQGTFELPVAATVDATGRVYVLDQAKKKVYKFLPTSMR